MLFVWIDKKFPLSTPIFGTSWRRFAVLSIITFGFYSRYWMYTNWKDLRRIDQTGMDPIFATMLGPVLVPWLVALIEIDNKNQPNRWVTANKILCVVAFLIMTWLGKKEDLWFLFVFSFIALLPINDRIRKINELFADGPSI